MTIMPITANVGLIFYGPKVHYQQFIVYEIMKTMDATVYAWGAEIFEKDYPGLVDLQVQHYAAQGKMNSLADAANNFGVNWQKSSVEDYNVYDNSFIGKVE